MDPCLLKLVSRRCCTIFCERGEDHQEHGLYFRMATLRPVERIYRRGSTEALIISTFAGKLVLDSFVSIR